MIKELNEIAVALLNAGKSLGFETALCQGFGWLDSENQVIGYSKEGLAYVGIDDALSLGFYIRRASDAIGLSNTKIGACDTIQKATLGLRFVAWASEGKPDSLTLGNNASLMLYRFAMPSSPTVSDVRIVPSSVLLDRERIGIEEMPESPTFNPVASLVALDFDLSFIFNPCKLEKIECL